MPRVAAALLALVAICGLGLEMIASTAELGSVPAMLWKLSDYFTIFTNALVIVVFVGVALGKRVSPLMLALTTMSIVLVGAVYAILLAKTMHLSGLHLVADRVMHYIVPPLVALWWLAFAPKGELKWSAPFVISAYPLTYLAYALLRGSMTDHYPYPFMDLAKIGAAQAAINCTVIAAAFFVVGLGMVALDHFLGARASRR